MFKNKNEDAKSNESDFFSIPLGQEGISAQTSAQNQAEEAQTPHKTQNGSDESDNLSDSIESETGRHAHQKKMQKVHKNISESGLNSNEMQGDGKDLDSKPQKNKLRGQTTFTKWYQDEEERVDFQPLIKQDSSEEIIHKKFFHNFQRQFTQLVEDNPPLPLLPKSVIVRSESPRTGGITHFLKITKFRGQDYGKSQFIDKDQEVEQVNFSGTGTTTLRYIFQPLQSQGVQLQTTAKPPQAVRIATMRDIAAKKEDTAAKRALSAQKENPVLSKDDKGSIIQETVGTSNQPSSRNLPIQKTGQKEQIPTTSNVLSPNGTIKEIEFKEPKESLNMSRMTAVGELVYQKNALDFKAMNRTSKRDFVLEENLLDVKKLLKTSAFVDKTQQNQADPEKKQLIKVNLEPFYSSTGPDDSTLVFESRFESGNLAAAVKVSDNDYHLLLQNDVNTSGHTQWFFFRVHNVKVGEARFNLLNLCKPDSLYNEGMKVLVYSERISALKDIGWHRGGTKISYYQNQIRKGDDKKSQNQRFYYTHTFTYNFEYANDTVYFAYCYPYTYTDMLEDLSKIMQDPNKASFCKRQTLCDTLAGNKCEMLTITSRQNLETLPKRKGIVITARVHPGESVGSWMIKGVMNFLTSTDDPAAELLRQNFVFKILPMLNPDGVINGNYRCSLAGCDLNRRWKAPSKVLHPTIYSAKQMILQFSKERELFLFCDFHGHSRRKNIFMYGCNVPQSPEDTRIFPFILGSICPFFVYNYSRFGNQKSKEATARMALFNELKTPNIYTLEASFQGNDCGQFKNYHFSTENLIQTGIDFCKSLLVFATINCPNYVLDDLMKNINGIYNHYQVVNNNLQTIEKDPDVELMKLYKDKINQLQENKIPINTTQIKKALLKVLRQHQDVQTDGDNTSSAGSDNAPSEDNLNPEEIAQVVPQMEGEIVKKKKKMENEKVANPNSPLKRRATIKEQKDSAQAKGIRLNPTKIQKQGTLKKKDADSAREEKKSDTEKEGSPQKKEEEVKTEVVTEENVVHKKKLKKNVESRDACTQTERSDYMLIKQRQKQKEIIQLAKQGQLPPGITPQQLVQSFIQIQPNSQQFIQIDPQKQLNKTQGPMMQQQQQQRHQNSNQRQQQNAYQLSQGQQYLQQAHSVKQNTRQMQQNSYQNMHRDQNLQNMTMQEILSNDAMFYPQNMKMDNLTIGSNIYQQQMANNSFNPQSQAQWAAANVQRQNHQSYSPQKQRKVLKGGQNAIDPKVAATVQIQNVQNLFSQEQQRAVVSQHGPRTTSLGNQPNQPFDASKNWEHAIQQQKMTNAALNQWIQLKNKEQAQLLGQTATKFVVEQNQLNQPQIINRTTNANSMAATNYGGPKSILVTQQAIDIQNAHQQNKNGGQTNLSHYQASQFIATQSQAAVRGPPYTNNNMANDGLPDIVISSPNLQQKQPKSQYKGPIQNQTYAAANIVGSRESLTSYQMAQAMQVAQGVDKSEAFQMQSKSSLHATGSESQKKPKSKLANQPVVKEDTIRSLNSSQVMQNQPQRKVRAAQNSNGFSKDSLQKAVHFVQDPQRMSLHENFPVDLQNQSLPQSHHFAVLENSFIKQKLEQQQMIQQTSQQMGMVEIRRKIRADQNLYEEQKHNQSFQVQSAENSTTQMIAQQVQSMTHSIQEVQNTPNKQSRTTTSQNKTQDNRNPQMNKGKNSVHQNVQNSLPQQFFHVQRIVPANDHSGHVGGSNNANSQENMNGKGVKFNIVNVHNEFNIQNNIIIQQPQVVGQEEVIPTSQPKQKKGKKNQSMPPAQKRQ